MAQTYNQTLTYLRDCIKDIQTQLNAMELDGSQPMDTWDDQLATIADIVQGLRQQISADDADFSDIYTAIVAKGQSPDEDDRDTYAPAIMAIETDPLLDADIDGNEAEYTTTEENTLKSLKVQINPIQDLHGYSNPWRGGKGKNKLPTVLSVLKTKNTSGTWNNNAYIHNGVTFIVNVDNENNILGITISGTSTARTDFYFVGSASVYESIGLAEATYLFNGGNANARVYLAKNGGGLIYSDSDEDKAFQSLSTDTYRVLVRVESSVTISTPITIQPMIRLSTVTDATFAPYENKCNISGLTGLNITNNSDSYLVQFGQTLYKAEIDPLKGKAKLLGVFATYNSSSGWSMTSGRYTHAKPTGAVSATAEGTAYCNLYKFARSSSAATDGTFYVGTSNFGIVDSGFSTLEEFTNYISNNHLQLYVNLTTAAQTEIDIDQIGIIARLGDNTLDIVENVLITECKYTKKNIAGVYQNKSVTPTSSQQTITADAGFDALGTVTVGAGGSANLGTLNVTPAVTAQTLTPTSPLDGWDEVDVAAVTSSIDANIQQGNIKAGVQILGVVGTYTGGTVNLQSKTVNSSTSQQTVTPDSGYQGLSDVTVEPYVLESKTVTPTTSQQTIQPTSGKDGLSQVVVDAVTSSIDANIQAGNIKKDIQILGVTGTYEGSGGGGITLNPHPTTLQYAGCMNDTSHTDALPLDGSWTTEVDLANINAAQGVRYLFYNNTTITSVDLTGWDFSNITDSRYFFSGCSNLVTITGDINLNKTTSVSSAFANCSSLVNLPLKSFGFGATTNSLTLDLSACTSLDADTMIQNMNTNSSGKTRIIKLAAAVYNNLSSTTTAAAASKNITLQSA